MVPAAFVAGALLADVFVAGAFLAAAFFVEAVAAAFLAPDVAGFVAVVLAALVADAVPLDGEAFVVLVLVDFRVTLEVTLLAAAAVLPAIFFAADRAMAAVPLFSDVWRSPHACGEDMPSPRRLQTNAESKPTCLAHTWSGRLDRIARR